MPSTGTRHPARGARSTAYDWIRDEIAGGSLPPGEWIRETQLAEVLGVSRTPVREALYALAAEGVVEIVHNRGARVSAWTVRDVDEVYRLRALLEGEGARLAAVRPSSKVVSALREHDRAFTTASEQLSRLRAEGREGSDAAESALDRAVAANGEFHRAVLDAAGSARLRALLVSVSSTPLVTQAFHHYSDADLRRSTAGHHDILVAFERRDPVLTEAAMRSHILGARHAAAQSALDAPRESTTNGDNASYQ
ncbi:GntR family transcriptional regulator [Pseudonocardia sp. TMWB2A]|uniref:GntR family transcriptional regulator n=1 Tax=Pseudonocardia sp. TMWB2A TaxID=687430 RepID=UPI00307F6B5B